MASHRSGGLSAGKRREQADHATAVRRNPTAAGKPPAASFLWKSGRDGQYPRRRPSGRCEQPEDPQSPPLSGAAVLAAPALTAPARRSDCSCAGRNSMQISASRASISALTSQMPPPIRITAPTKSAMLARRRSASVSGGSCGGWDMERTIRRLPRRRVGKSAATLTRGQSLRCVAHAEARCSDARPTTPAHDVKSYDAIVSLTLATSVLSSNGLARNACWPCGSLLANASSA